MKIDIHALCSGLEQEDRVPDPRNVVIKTMAKVESEAPARRRTRPLLALLAAAALLAVLSIGAFAAAKAVRGNRAIRVKDVSGTAYTAKDGEVVHEDVEFALQFDAPRQGNLVVFRTGWMPRNANEPYLFSLGDYLASYRQAGREVPSTAMSAQQLEKCLVHLEWEYFEDEAPEWDSPIFTLTVDVYSAGEIKDRDYLLQGDIQVIREEELLGMEALYLESELSGVTGRNLLLYDADRGCLIVLGTDGTFETMEKVAEGLEIIDTDIVSENLNPDWSWSCLGLGGAAG